MSPESKKNVATLLPNELSGLPSLFKRATAFSPATTILPSAATARLWIYTPATNCLPAVPKVVSKEPSPVRRTTLKPAGTLPCEFGQPNTILPSGCTAMTRIHGRFAAVAEGRVDRAVAVQAEDPKMTIGVTVGPGTFTGHDDLAIALDRRAADAGKPERRRYDSIRAEGGVQSAVVVEPE